MATEHADAYRQKPQPSCRPCTSAQGRPACPLQPPALTSCADSAGGRSSSPAFWLLVLDPAGRPRPRLYCTPAASAASAAAACSAAIFSAASYSKRAGVVWREGSELLRVCVRRARVARGAVPERHCMQQPSSTIQGAHCEPCLPCACTIQECSPAQSCPFAANPGTAPALTCAAFLAACFSSQSRFIMFQISSLHLTCTGTERGRGLRLKKPHGAVSRAPGRLLFPYRGRTPLPAPDQAAHPAVPSPAGKPCALPPHLLGLCQVHLHILVINVRQRVWALCLWCSLLHRHNGARLRAGRRLVALLLALPARLGHCSCCSGSLVRAL